MKAKNEKLYALFELAVRHNLVRTKGDFAKFIGIERGTLSHAFANDEKASPENAVIKVENALLRAGVSLEQVITSSPGAANVVDNNNTVGIPAKKFAHEKKLLALLEEKDKQIARLLGIIETLSAKVRE